MNTHLFTIYQFFLEFIELELVFYFLNMEIRLPELKIIMLAFYIIFSDKYIRDECMPFDIPHKIHPHILCKQKC